MIMRRLRCIWSLAVAMLLMGCRGGAVAATTGSGLQPTAGVLEYGNDRSTQLYVLPRAPEPRTPLDSAVFVRVPPLREGGRMVAYGGTPSNRGAVLWLLVAAERDGRRGVTLQEIRIGGAAEPTDDLLVTGTAIPAAAACRTNGWIAAFFIEGVAPPPTGSVVLRYQSDSLWYRVELDPRRHTVRGGPWVTLHPADVGRRVFDEHLTVQLPRPVAPGLLAALRHDDRGWRGWAQVGTFGRFSWSYLPNMHGPPPSVDELRLYAWRLPSACEAWVTPRDA